MENLYFSVFLISNWKKSFIKTYKIFYSLQENINDEKIKYFNNKVFQKRLEKVSQKSQIFYIEKIFKKKGNNIA